MTLQTVDPSQAVITSVGSSLAGGIGFGHPMISGTADPGNVVQVYDGVRMIGTALTRADGTWSFQQTTEMKVGLHRFAAIPMDDAGNYGASSNVFNIVAIQVPVAIVTVFDSVGIKTGPIPQDGITDDARPAVSGVGVAGDTIRLYDHDLLVGSALVDIHGNWSILPASALPEGDCVLTATATHSDGSTETSAEFRFTIDTSVPDKPVIDSITDTKGLAIVAATSDVHPDLSGVGKAGDTITLYEGNTVLGSAIVDASGHWSVKPSADLSYGNHDVYVIESTRAGGQSVPSDHAIFNVFMVPPSTPLVTALIDALGPLAGNVSPGGLATDARPTLTGTGHQGDTINVYDNGTLLGTTLVAENGAWSFMPASLKSGAHSLTVTESNAAGTSPASAPYPFTYTQILITGMTDASGHAVANGGTTDSAVKITCWIDPAVHADKGGLYLMGGPFGNWTNLVYPTPTISGNTLTVVLQRNTFGGGTDSGYLPNGTYSFCFKVSGSTTGISATTPTNPALIWSVTDTWSLPVPNTPSITSLVDAVGSITGPIVNGQTTDDPRPTLSGTGTTGNTITLYDNGVLVATAVVAANKTWSIQPAAALGNGPHSFTVSEANMQGSSARTTPITFTLDTTTPATPLLPVVTDGADTVISADSSTTSNRPTFSGTGAAGDIIMLYDGPNVVGSGKIDATGHWSIRPSTALNNGAHDFTLTETNAAGTSSTHSEHIAFTVASGGVQSTHTPVTPDGQTDPVMTPVNHTIIGMHDMFIGSSAHESIDLAVDPTVYFSDNAAHIEGAKGAIDVLTLLGDHQVLDLTSLTGKTASAKLSGVEVFDLNGHSNTLKLSLVDVLNLGEVDIFQGDGNQQVLVNGKQGDSVDLSNSHVAGLDSGEWAQHGTAQIGGLQYDVYEHSSAHAELLIQQGIHTIVH